MNEMKDPFDHQISDLLKREQSYRLSSDFERKVMTRLVARESPRDLFWLWAGLISIGVAAVVAIVITGFKPNFGAFRFLSTHSGLFIFAVGFILILQRLERKFLHKASF